MPTFHTDLPDPIDSGGDVYVEVNGERRRYWGCALMALIEDPETGDRSMVAASGLKVIEAFPEQEPHHRKAIRVRSDATKKEWRVP